LPAVCTLLSFKGGVTFSYLRSSNFRAKVSFPVGVLCVVKLSGDDDFTARQLFRERQLPTKNCHNP
jgi:hypothetical protein